MQCNRFIFLAVLWCNFTPANGKAHGKRKKEIQNAYACLTKDVVEVKCGLYEVITISQVLFGGEPTACTGSFTDRNECQQLSPTWTDKAKSQCDGEYSCKLPTISPRSDELKHEEIEGVQNNCNVGGKLHSRVIVNYMIVKFTCQGFKFCESVPKMEVKRFMITNKDFPELSVTNPTCECTFNSDNSASYVSSYVFCNGTVTFVSTESIPNPESSSPEFIEIEKRYYCQNHTKEFIRIGSPDAVSITVSIDHTNSSERSSFSIKPVILALRGGTPRRKQGANIGVSCTKGSLWLTKTTKLILYTTIPISTVIIVALIVLYCVIKKRRKKARAWRRRHVKLARSESVDSRTTTTYKSGYIPQSPPASEISSVPSSVPSTTRRKPEGKLDSDSDDDLTKLATKLHRQNTQRKIDDIKKRELFYNNGIEGVWSQSKSYLPRTHAPYADLDQLQGRQAISRQPLYVDRRCMSIGNLRRGEGVVANDNSDSEYSSPLKRTQSAANSRTNLRSARKRANRMSPGHTADNGYHSAVNDNLDSAPKHPKGYKDIDKDDDSSMTPNSRSNPTYRQPPYGAGRSMSIGNLGHQRADHNPRTDSLHGTRSVSQSRTSLRSTKRRAPQPPGQPPVHPLPRNYPQVPHPDETRYDPRYNDHSQDYHPVRDVEYSRGGTYRSRAGSPDRGGTPYRSRAGSPDRGGTPHRSRAGSPTDRGGTPHRSRAGSPDRGGTPYRSRAGSHTDRGGTPHRSRAGSPDRGGTPHRSRAGSAIRNNNSNHNLNRSKPEGSGNGNSEPIHKGHNPTTNGHKLSPKPKYFNSYAVRPPVKPKPSKSKMSDFSSRHDSAVAKDALRSVLGSEAASLKARRYPDEDDSNHELSDHDLEDIHQVDILGNSEGEADTARDTAGADDQW